MKRKEDFTILERLYFLEVIKGVLVTGGHFVRNFCKLALRFAGLSQNRGIATFQYPDERRPYPARYRGRHRLTLKSDGSVKCTACFLCATACPAKCIFIEPTEHPDPHVEKYPARYEIDTLLCVYCGYCVDACPVDAIRMDTGMHPEIYSSDPRDYVEDKEVLMERSRLLQERGPDALFEQHMQRMRNIERRPFELSQPESKPSSE